MTARRDLWFVATLAAALALAAAACHLGHQAAPPQTARPADLATIGGSAGGPAAPPLADILGDLAAEPDPMPIPPSAPPAASTDPTHPPAATPTAARPGAFAIPVDPADPSNWPTDPRPQTLTRPDGTWYWDGRAWTYQGKASTTRPATTPAAACPDGRCYRQ
jgi:hypothetical protein